MKLKRKTIEKDEEYLRQISSEVNFDTDDYIGYIEALKEYCKNNAVYALAPVQIGIPKRIIYFRNTTSDMTKNKDSKYDESIVLINPIILNAKGRTRFIERCESCMDYVGWLIDHTLLRLNTMILKVKKSMKSLRDLKQLFFVMNSII